MSAELIYTGHRRKEPQIHNCGVFAEVPSLRFCPPGWSIVPFDQTAAKESCFESTGAEKQKGSGIPVSGRDGGRPLTKEATWKEYESFLEIQIFFSLKMAPLSPDGDTSKQTHCR